MNELQQHLPELIAHRAERSISMYLPMASARDALGNTSVRFKNLLKDVRGLLDVDTTSALLAPLDELARAPGAAEWLWRGREPGLAVFHSERGTGVYKLPIEVEPLVVVEDRFHLKPLLGLLGQPHRFHVLALSRNETRLLEADRWGVTQITDERIPPSLAATTPEVEGGKRLQMHSGPGHSAVFHGQGAGEHRADEDLRRFLTAVDAGVQKVLRGRHAPLVLAGVAELTARFRGMSTHPFLVEGTIDGNVEGRSAADLRERAAALVMPLLRDGRRRAWNRVAGLRHTKRVTSSVERIVCAALDGRVATLFLQKGERRWGRFDGDTRSVSFDGRQTKHNEDLLDLAAIETAGRGGDVFLVEPADMPLTDEPAAAMLRY